METGLASARGLQASRAKAKGGADRCRRATILRVRVGQFGRCHLKHETRRFAVLLDGRSLDDHRSGDIDDDTGLAGRGEATAKRFDKPDRGLTWQGGQLQFYVGKIDENAIGIGEGKNLEVDGALKANDEAGAVLLAFEAPAMPSASGPVAAC